MANTTTVFSGTTLSGEHIGTAPSRRAAALLKDADSTPVKVVLGTPGAEAANAISTALTLQDVDGRAFSGTVVLYCEVIPRGTNFTLSEDGAGAELSTTASNTLLISTDSTGAASVKVTDASGSSTATVQLMVSVVGRLGVADTASLTFA